MPNPVEKYNEFLTDFYSSRGHARIVEVNHLEYREGLITEFKTYDCELCGKEVDPQKHFCGFCGAVIAGMKVEYEE